MGEEASRRLLVDCEMMSAYEAKKVGLVLELVKHEDLMREAQALAELWKDSGKKRKMIDGGDREEYSALNALESIAVADAFLSYRFLNTQFLNSKKRGKLKSSAVFWFL